MRSPLNKPTNTKKKCVKRYWSVFAQVDLNQLLESDIENTDEVATGVHRLENGELTITPA